jgi:cyanophycin synthetase
VILYGRIADSDALAAHLANGRRAVIARGDDVLLAIGAETSALAGLLAGRDPDAVLPAIATGWAIGLTPDALREGIMSFEASPQPRAATPTTPAATAH